MVLLLLQDRRKTKAFPVQLYPILVRRVVKTVVLVTPIAITK